MLAKKDLRKISDCLFEIPKSFRPDMKASARVYASEKMLDQILSDESLVQLVNVATLPGIVKYALAMPDIHEGYGFPIGGVMASSMESGVISPGGVGFDINCGVRLLTSRFSHEDLEPKIEDLANQLQRDIPSGVGRGGNIRLSGKEMDGVLREGVGWAVEKGYALEEDSARCEEGGCMVQADPGLVSERAKRRGSDQLGTLGSGNHFLEVQKVEAIFDNEAAQAFGLKQGQVVLSIHTGSRGLGHQVCTDYVRLLNTKLPTWGIRLPDRELAYAPLASREGREYLGAMAAAANFAWCNRQLITRLVRLAWKRILGGDARLDLVYDVAHNIAKVEKHEINGENKEVCVHRKGATRAFPPGHLEIPKIYQAVGQPVLIPGSMGTSSYVLAGAESAMKNSFGSVCHGAGRRLSRKAAKRQVWGADLRKELLARGIVIRCHSTAGLAEEAPLAYKDVDAVVDIIAKAGLAKKVARLKPMAVIKA